MKLHIVKGLRALFSRCSSIIHFLYLENINVATKIGLHFKLLSNIKHFAMTEEIDVWHLKQIKKTFAPSLISLGLVLNKNEETLDAFLSMISKCKMLQCLKINRFNDIFERSQTIGKHQFLPATLKKLLLSGCSNNRYDYSIKALPELDIFSNLQILIYLYSNDVYTEMRMFSFYYPFYLTNDLHNLFSHTSLMYLRALKICTIPVYGSDLLKIAQFCPNLEHLDIFWEFKRDLDGFVNTKQLEALYTLKKLSSLSISMNLEDLNENKICFHDYVLQENTRLDDFFMEVIKNMNSITELRSLEMRRTHGYFFEKAYVLEMLEKLPGLENFKCTIIDWHEIILFDETITSKINRILKKNCKPKVFRFVNMYSREDDIVLNYNGRSFELTRLPKINPWKDYNFLQSNVLKQILNQSLGNRETDVLFGTYHEERI